METMKIRTSQKVKNSYLTLSGLPTMQSQPGLKFIWDNHALPDHLRDPGQLSYGVLMNLGKSRYQSF